MSIQDFHSKLSSQKENSALFQVLRHLRRLENVQCLLFDEEATAGGWGPWAEGTQPPQHSAVAGI